MKLCGNVQVNGLRAGEGLRDLFVVLEAKDSKENGTETGEGEGQEVTCFAKCGNGKAMQRLPKNLKRKVEYDCVCGLQRQPVKVEYEADNDEMVIRYRR